MCAHCRNVSVELQEKSSPETGSGTTDSVDPGLEKTISGYAARFCLLLVKGYQYVISPLFPPCCRYTPTCSEYAIEAVTRYGAVRGMWLAICRILRCHPFVRGGYDPVK